MLDLFHSIVQVIIDESFAAVEKRKKRRAAAEAGEAEQKPLVTDATGRWKRKF